MRRLLFPAILFVSALCLCGCDVENMSSLTEFSEPYTGVYACKALTLGGADMLGKFDYVTLELKYGGDFALNYRTEEGHEGELAGTYSLDEAGHTVTLTYRSLLRSAEHRFAYEKGAILMDVNVGGDLLHAEFRMP